MQRAAVEPKPREAVVEAAAKIFLRDGFQAASVRRVAAAAGMTTGAIYSSFEGKADLFLAVLEEKLDPRLEEMYGTVREAPMGEVGARVGEQFSAYLEQRRRWLILLIEFWAQAAGDRKARRAFVRRHEGLRTAITDALSERAGRLGTPLPMPASELATVLIALTNGFAVERLGDPSAAPEDLYARALDLLLA
jgi:AcrR family transcriptional regulator